MTARPPIPCAWTGKAFEPLPQFLRVASAHYGDGEVVDLVETADRSAATHRHFFALVNECWHSLPEDIAEQFPTAERLRKYALIKAGFRDERSIVCASKAEAHRVAAFVKPMDEFAVVAVSGPVVVVYTAKSQSMRAMNKEDFAASKEAVLNVLSEMLGVDTDTLGKAAA